MNLTSTYLFGITKIHWVTKPLKSSLAFEHSFDRETRPLKSILGTWASGWGFGGNGAAILTAEPVLVVVRKALIDAFPVSRFGCYGMIMFTGTSSPSFLGIRGIFGWRTLESFGGVVFSVCVSVVVSFSFSFSFSLSLSLLIILTAIFTFARVLFFFSGDSVLVVVFVVY
jgi:hypothetical protein